MMLLSHRQRRLRHESPYFPLFVPIEIAEKRDNKLIGSQYDGWLN
jgi:hypothetical protein